MKLTGGGGFITRRNGGRSCKAMQILQNLAFHIGNSQGSRAQGWSNLYMKVQDTPIQAPQLILQADRSAQSSIGGDLDYAAPPHSENLFRREICSKGDAHHPTEEERYHGVQSQYCYTQGPCCADEQEESAGIWVCPAHQSSALLQDACHIVQHILYLQDVSTQSASQVLSHL